jgi:hypothetical protein
LEAAMVKTVIVSEPLTPVQHSQYRSIIGGLAYAANMTRIDISYAVGILSRQLASPTVAHLNAAKRMLRYLLYTKHYHMVFKPHTFVSMTEVYVDASYAGDLTDRKSTSGVITKVLGNTITWQSIKQPVVALSSTEAEYIALSDATREIQWYRTWLHEVLGFSAPTVMWCDNTAAATFAKHDGSHQRTKHIDVRYHHMRQYTDNGTIIVKYISTNEQLADFLTKVLDKITFNKFIVQCISTVVQQD